MFQDPFKFERKINKLVIGVENKKIPKNKALNNIDKMFKETKSLPIGHKRKYKNTLFDIKRRWRV